MDGRGRLAEPLKGMARWRSPVARHATARAATRATLAAAERRLRLPSRCWIAGCRFSIDGCGAALGFTVSSSASFWRAAPTALVKGDHLPSHRSSGDEMRATQAANAAGFRIMTIALAGNSSSAARKSSPPPASPAARRCCSSTSNSARARLKANPWIAEATVLKLYPGRLQIGVTERHAFALWQKDGGCPSSPTTARCSSPMWRRTLARLPLVVGQGAETRAQGIPGSARPLSARCATRCAPRCWSPSGAGTCGSRTASTCGCRNRTLRPRSNAGGARPRQEALIPATSSRSICGCRTA